MSLFPAFSKSPERVIVFAAGTPGVEWIVSPEILAEYKEVLGREKFGLPTNLLKHWFNIIERSTTLVEPIRHLDFPRDQKDAKFLVCAIISNADYFITGDHDFNEARRLLKTMIIPVSMFIRLVIEPYEH